MRALLAAVPALITVLKFAGGLYLLYIALRGAITAVRGEASLKAAIGTDGLSDVAAWRRGVFVVLTNPKAALMWSAIASFLYGSGFGSVEVLLFGPFTVLLGERDLRDLWPPVLVGLCDERLCEVRAVVRGGVRGGVRNARGDPSDRRNPRPRQRPPLNFVARITGTRPASTIASAGNAASANWLALARA